MSQQNFRETVEGILHELDNVCLIAQVHGAPYTGPNLLDAIVAAAVARIPKQAEQMREPYGNFVEGWNAAIAELRQSLQGQSSKGKE